MFTKIVNLVIAITLLTTAPVLAHEDSGGVFVQAEQLGLIDGDPTYYPFVGDWQEVRHAFQVMTQSCEGWLLIDRHEDIGDPYYYCDGEALAWEYVTAWSWATNHWVGDWEIGDPGTQGVERWRPIVEYYFIQAGVPGQVDNALRVMRCESKGRPDAANPRSSADGLFQHLDAFRDRNAWRIGEQTYDKMDPIDNIAVTAAVVAVDRGWRQWACKRVL